MIINKLKITIARKCCLKGTDWKLTFGSSVGIIEKILACVQPELQASYTRNTYNNVLCIMGLTQGVHKLENFTCFLSRHATASPSCIWPSGKF